MSERRSRTTREYAEAALIRLVDAAGERAQDLIVVGGLVPDYLTAHASEVHLGTLDVDIVLSVGFVFDRDELDFRWLEDAMARAGFEPASDSAGGDGWRWATTVGGRLVKVELLCDVPGDQSSVPVALPGCARASAVNLQGPGAALVDVAERTVGGPEHSRRILTAGLGGYLLTKAAAVARRGESRDFYDFAFVLIHNDLGGPVPAAVAVDACLSALERSMGSRAAVYRDRLDAAVSAFVDTDNRSAAETFATESGHAGVADHWVVLVEDATSAARLFEAELTRLRATRS